MKSKTAHFALALLFVCLPTMGWAQTTTQTPTQDPAPKEAPAPTEVIVLVTGGKAAVRTLADKQAPAVLEPPMGQLLRIVGPRKAAFVPVEAPGGYPVWVYGSFLRPTAETGVLEVTANAVNQRQMPSSGQVSFPLDTRLHAGDRVRVIARNDANKPLAEDWVQVWSSADSYGWILESDISPVKTDGAKLWTDAIADLGARTATAKSQVREDGTDLPAGSTPTQQPQAVTTERIAQARLALDKADAQLANLRTTNNPDLSEVRAAYQMVVEANVSSDLTKRAEGGLAVVKAIEEANALASDLEAEKTRRLESLIARQRQLWEESRRRDPLGGRFYARGVLEIQARAGEAPHYVLRWGPELVCEVRCSSGKYDLALFASYELGLKGVLDYADETALLSERPVLEIGRIEVLSRRK